MRCKKTYKKKWFLCRKVEINKVKSKEMKNENFEKQVWKINKKT